MFNAEIKNQFMDWYDVGESSMQFVRGMFSTSEEYEIKFGKDIAQMTYAELIITINGFNNWDLRYYYTLMSYLKAYVSWGLENQAFDDVSDDVYRISPVDIDFIGAFQKKVFRDEEDFISSIRKVREFNQGYPDVPALMFLWCGFEMKDVPGITDDEVDFTSNTICHGGFCAHFSENVSKVLKEFSDTKVAYRENASCQYPVYKDLAYDGFIKPFYPGKSTRISKPVSVSQLNNYIRRANERYGNLGYFQKITPKDVWNSGRLNALHIAEESGIDILSAENKDLVFEIIRKPNMYDVFIREYQMFKKAFNY